ncbi:MAG: ABC transporter ATP-binding protein [Clostridiales bacterium]|nr:ABC transporter ATP-binding protein [Clostridiales bacterium]
MREERSTILKTTDLTIGFGGLLAVDTLNLAVKEGEIYGLIGPNGAGKTTVFNLIMRYYDATSGEILFRGKPVKGLSVDKMVKAGMARTFQNIRLFTELTVLDNILAGMHVKLGISWIESMLGLRHYGARMREMKERAIHLLEDLGLADKQNEIAGGLAYGVQRRLEIARALASEPCMVLLDEPAAGMNRQEIVELNSFIRNIRDKYGLTVLIIEHHMSLVMNLCDHLTVLNYGKTIATGTPAEIQCNPVVIASYLGKQKEATRHA